MSTKATIAHGPDFHLYHEVFDDEHVYLMLAGVEFEATPESVMVRIPGHIWEVIRHYEGTDLSFVEKTFEEVRQFVEERVQQRIERYAETAEHNKDLTSLAGIIPFGPAESPREEQIERGLKYYLDLRDQQKQVKEKVAELKRLNAPH